MISSTHHLDFVGKSIQLANIFKVKTLHLLSSYKNPLFLDATPVEGQHIELLMHNQGIYLL